MAINFPGPYELRIFYTSSDINPGGPMQHEMRLNVDVDDAVSPGDPFDTIVIKCADLATPFLDDVVEDWLALLAPLLAPTATFDFVELWKYPTEQSFESEFVSVYTPLVTEGTHAGAAIPASQSIFTFRTLEGGIMKVAGMETSFSPGIRQSRSQMASALGALADYVIGGNGSYGAPFLGRDTSYPFATIAHFPGQNEALFKRRYR